MAIGVRQQFAGGFRCSIRRNRCKRRVFTKRRRGCRTIHRTGRTKDKPFDAVAFGQIEQVHRAGDIDVLIGARVHHRRPYARLRAQMNDRIEHFVGKKLFERFVIAQISFDQAIGRMFQVFFDVGAFNLRIVELIKIVQHHDSRSLQSQQPIHQMTSNKTGSARDQKTSFVHSATLYHTSAREGSIDRRNFHHARNLFANHTNVRSVALDCRGIFTITSIHNNQTNFICDHLTESRYLT